MDFGRYTPEELRFEILSQCWPTPSGCLEWIGGTNGNGYGRMSLGCGRTEYTHRAIYTIERGPIPEGLQIDHLCRNTLCCNSDHLEAVTAAENARRAGPASKAALKELARTRVHCKRGHKRTEENTYTHPITGHRQCRLCRQKTVKARRRVLKAAKGDGRHPIPVVYYCIPTTIQELADRFGVNRYTLRRRIALGWPQDKWGIPASQRNRGYGS